MSYLVHAVALDLYEKNCENVPLPNELAKLVHTSAPHAEDPQFRQDVENALKELWRGNHVSQQAPLIF